MACEKTTIRIKNKTKKSDNGCLFWTGGKDKDGYGKIYFNRRYRRVHTVVYELVNGPIPTKNLIQHTCDNPSCIRLEHLRMGTPLSNMQDKVKKGRLRNQNTGKTHCKYGHKFTDDNTIKRENIRVCRKCSKRRGREQWARIKKDRNVSSQ